MAMELHEIEESLKGLHLKHTDLETRIMAVEKKASADKSEWQEEMRAMHKQLTEVNNKLSSLETLEDANFLAITHMLGVIGRKLKIPTRELKTGAR